MKTIACYVDMGKMNQDILLVEEGKDPKIVGGSSVTNFRNMLLSLCILHNVSKIHLYGNEDYLAATLEDLRTCLGYSIRNIEIEVN